MMRATLSTPAPRVYSSSRSKAGLQRHPQSSIFNDNGTTAGNFPDDVEFPGLDAPPYDWFSTEAVLNLDLLAGYYRFGVNSDDGFKLASQRRKGARFANSVGVFDMAAPPAILCSIF